MNKQINLLPPAEKKEIMSELSSQNLKSMSRLALIVLAVLPVILFTIYRFQMSSINNNQKEINASVSTIRRTVDLDTMLTVKDGLAVLPDLYKTRTAFSDFYSVLSSVSNPSIQLTNLQVDSDGRTVFSGSSNSYNNIYRFFEVLKNSGRKPSANTGADSSTTGHFSNLKLQEIGGVSGGRVAFKITGNYNRPVEDTKNVQ